MVIFYFLLFSYEASGQPSFLSPFFPLLHANNFFTYSLTIKVSCYFMVHELTSNTFLFSVFISILVCLFDYISTFAFQLDICQEMARYLTGASAWLIVWVAVSLCLDICYFSNCDAYYMGKLVDNDIGSRYNWFGCNHGWHCSFVGVLFNHALVENSMAKLKYVFCYILIL